MRACADRVRFLGFVPDAELVAYYDACDVFCMPSTERAEQFGLVQLEAMHCGKPVVATRLGTGVEYVTLDEVTGLLVEPGNERALGQRAESPARRPAASDPTGRGRTAPRRRGVLRQADGRQDRFAVPNPGRGNTEHRHGLRG